MRLGMRSTLIVGKMLSSAYPGIRVLETGNTTRYFPRSYLKETKAVTEDLVTSEPKAILFYFGSNLNLPIVLLYSLLSLIKGKKRGFLFLKMDSDGAFICGKKSVMKFMLLSSFIFSTLFYDRILIESTCGKNRLEKIAIDPSRIIVMETGVPASSSDVQRINRNKNLNLLSVSRVVPEKGIEYLIKAFYLVKDEHPRWNLVLAGPIEDSSYHRSLERYILDLGIKDHVTFTGELSERDLESLYITSGIFCSLTSKEGFSISRLEALRRGLPTIVSKAGWGEDLEKYGAISVDIENMEETRNTLNKVMKAVEDSSYELKSVLAVPEWNEICSKILKLTGD